MLDEGRGGEHRAGGNFWGEPLPPRITLTTSNIDPDASTDLHCDVTDAGLPDGSFDVAVFDPPHNPDAGVASYLGQRHGTVKSIAALQRLQEEGCREAWRISRLGIIVKVQDQRHGNQYVEQTEWVRHAIPTRLYTKLEQLGSPTPRHGKRRLHQRVPYKGASTYLVFRKDGHQHRDFDLEYLEQERMRCLGCNEPLKDRRRQSTTCSDRCRAQAYRQRRASA